MRQEIIHTIPGPGRVDADFGDVVIPTDHPPEGAREGRAPEPWLLFLASIGTCMTSFVSAYCREHDLGCEGIRLIQRQEIDEARGLVTGFAVAIEVPGDFPAEHRAALVDAAGCCTVKRVMEAGPRFTVTLRDRS